MKQILSRKKRRCLVIWSANSAPRGFTLLELILTLLIALIFSLLAVAAYQQSLRRSRLQTEAIALAARLEQAEALAKLGSNAPIVFQYRIRIDTANRAYIPEMYNTTGNNWVAAPSISSTSIKLARTISFGYGAITTSAPGQTSVTPLQATEIRFNSRGFPADKPTSGTSAAPPSPYNNAIYLTDGRNYFAVTVNILGRVQVWNYVNNDWFTITG
jgi:prepilin-type N-terminal cleavage/methylation domain-containing protein